ncbi:hypothetical protein AALB39_13630 [Lachnospiraceae bacterium 54-53]
MEIKVQERSNAPVPAAGEPGAADIREAVEAAELKGKIEAGDRLMEELARSAEENSEKKGQDEDCRETGSGRDTAALSKEGSYYKLSPEALSDIDLMWGKEQAELAWEDLLNWNPSLVKPVSDELGDLAVIYKELLLDILAHTAAGVKEEQLAGLDKLLSDILLKLLNARLGELDSWLDSFGTEASLKALRGALYRSVTGNAISGQELERIFRGSAREPGNTPYARGMEHGGSLRTPVNEGGGHGIIYQPAGEGRIKSDPRYAQRMQKEASSSGRGIMPGEGSASGAQASISNPGQNAVYSARDLETAERFARYMNREGNLFAALQLTGGSEELYGFLGAWMAIKSQAYIAGSGMDKGLAAHLREAMDRMIDFYFQEAFRRSEYGREGSAGGRKSPFQLRAAYRIYYYMMNLYRTSADPQEAVNKGLRQACQQFLKKKESLKPETGSGSFFTREKTDAIEDWKEGKRFLEKDWKEFLAFAGREGPGMIPLGVMELSPWGIFAEPEISPPQKGSGSPFFLMGAAAVLLLLLLFAAFMGI